MTYCDSFYSKMVCFLRIIAIIYGVVMCAICIVQLDILIAIIMGIIYTTERVIMHYFEVVR